MRLLFARPVLIRLYRAGLLLGAVWMIYLQAHWREAQRPPNITLAQARALFPAADRVELRDAERGLHMVLNARREPIGVLLKTLPFTSKTLGYSGPSDVLIAMDTKGAITSLKLLRSGDTPEHARKVEESPAFWRTFLGWNPGERPPPRVDAVSGATLTSSAIAESIQERLAGAAPSLRFPDPITIGEVRKVFTNAVRMTAERSRWRIQNATNGLAGFLLRTSPQADNVAGYRGPTESLVALAPDGRTITGLHIRKSYDTESYVDQVRRSMAFSQLFIGRSVEEVAAFDYPKQRVDGVSGATMTAHAVAEGIKRRMAAELRAVAQTQSWRPAFRDWALLGTTIGALVLSFSSLRGHRWIRAGWRLFLVGYVGLVSHDLLSLALIGGWAANGVAIQTAPALVLLAAVSLLVPWGSRRQIYCHQICPHGAAQQIAGTISGRIRRCLGSRGTSAQPTPVGATMTTPARAGGLFRMMEQVPNLLLGAAFLSICLGLGFNLANLEPFDAWVWRTAGLATLIIAVIGLVAAFFIPQAYCRYGCPTGALLRFVRTSGSADRWRQKDAVALGVVLIGAGCLAAARLCPAAAPEPIVTELTGRSFDSSWTVKIRDEVADPDAVRKALAREFDWAESMISHTRTNTGVWEFNHTSSTNPIAMPWPAVTLARWAAEISSETDGAYDITGGTLNRLWGVDTSQPPPQRPSNDSISAARSAMGWRKLEIGDGVLRKQNPAIELDFSSLAFGWAIDQAARVLERRGYTNSLIQAGGATRALGSWTVTLERPRLRCTLTNETLATSGAYTWISAAPGSPLPRLIDPRTGGPVTHDTTAVAVRHPDSTRASVWATALNIMGAESGLPVAERLNLAVVFVIERRGGSMESRASSAWQKVNP